VVAGDHEHRAAHRGEQLADALIGGGRRVVDEVAGDDRRVRRRGQAPDGVDRGRQRSRRVAVAGTDDDVRIAELGEREQRLGLARSS
jgi:hypothetical protein